MQSDKKSFITLGRGRNFFFQRGEGLVLGDEMVANFCAGDKLGDAEVHPSENVSFLICISGTASRS